LATFATTTTVNGRLWTATPPISLFVKLIVSVFKALTICGLKKTANNAYNEGKLPFLVYFSFIGLK
jgi:hypothetical protein